MHKILALAAITFLSGCSVPGNFNLNAGSLAVFSEQPTTWQLRSKHFIWGMPALKDNRYNFTPPGFTKVQPGVSVLVREGFAVGHLDMHKTPLWVSMRWTRADFRRSENAPKHGRPFKKDRELPEYAQAGKSYQGSQTGFDRGHLARHKDNAAWGKDNSVAGCLMSNIAPQKSHMNQAVWLELEDAHRFIVRAPTGGHNIRTLWVISGTIFAQTGQIATVGNGVGVPEATYKVIGWFESGGFHARGYVVPQNAQATDPTLYLTKIDDIEERTGLDFFPDFDEALEVPLEKAQHTDLWGT